MPFRAAHGNYVLITKPKEDGTEGAGVGVNLTENPANAVEQIIEFVMLSPPNAEGKREKFIHRAVFHAGGDLIHSGWERYDLDGVLVENEKGPVEPPPTLDNTLPLTPPPKIDNTLPPEGTPAASSHAEYSDHGAVNTTDTLKPKKK